MAIGSVRLINAVFYAHHGVMKEEHQIGGRYEVDVVMKVNFEEAAREDDLEKTIDYEAIYKVVKRIVTKNQFFLIEKLAYLIATEVISDYSVVLEAEVTVRKPNPPVGGPCDRAEAIYTAIRSV